jgi:adenylate cyclase
MLEYRFGCITNSGANRAPLAKGSSSMAKEIERKFLVKDLSVLAGLVGVPITQGYVASGDLAGVPLAQGYIASGDLAGVPPAQAYIASGGLRVRASRSGDEAFLTLEGPRVESSCDEFEYPIPVEDALAMLKGYATVGLLVRVRRSGDKAFLTLKGPRVGISCDEFEYPIPVEDALAMLKSYATGGVLSKTRYEVPVGNCTFEVDIFEGELTGLVVAEVELLNENQTVFLPDWLGREVSDDMAYTNISLVTAVRDGTGLPALA